jgi:D-lactate dehydrogenase
VKIACFELENWEKKYLEEKLKKHQLVFIDSNLTPRNVSKAKDCEALLVFVYSQVTKKVLDALRKVKLIATMSTGFDHIDLKACQQKRITVCNVPFYGENTVAEHAFALILALSKNIVPCVERTRSGVFSQEKLRGFDLKGKTVGIIGGGHIGMHVARMAKGFEMEVLVFDVHHDKKLEKSMGFAYATLNSLLKKSDIVSLHVPYNKHTHHLIDAKAFATMKKGSYLINTARGGIVDTHALVKALHSGKLAGAGLDVLEEECTIKEEKQLLSKQFAKECNVQTVLEDHMLMKMDNVLVTPHNAFNSKEALLRILDTTVENIQGFTAGKKKNKVV